MGWACPTEPGGAADTDGPFLEPFIRAQEPDTIAMFAAAAQANNNNSLASTTIVDATKLLPSHPPPKKKKRKDKSPCGGLAWLIKQFHF